MTSSFMILTKDNLIMRNMYCFYWGTVKDRHRFKRVMLEKRIQSNKYNIQRSGMAMDKNFARK